MQLLRNSVCIFLGCLCLTLSSHSWAETHVSGYLKSFAVAQDKFDNELFTTEPIYQSQNSARIMLESFTARTVWLLHYEVSPLFTSESLPVDLATFTRVGGNYRLTDVQASLSESEANKNQVYQNLDRFSVQLQFDAGDLTIGRQAIAFGSARIINPTDVFLPFDVRTFNTEYRTGVDAIRFQKPWGELGEVDFGLVLGKEANSETSAAFLKVSKNIAGKDLQFTYIDYAQQSLFGFGLQSAIFDLGFWFEAASVSGDDHYVRASTGLDYSFSENTFAQIEYHYNGAGSDNSANYLSQLNDVAYQRGGVFMLGEDYLIPNFSAQLSPLWNIGMSVIYNLSDDSSFISFSAEYNVADNFYMDFGYYHFSGQDIGLNALSVPTLNSEYGVNPDTFFMSIRYYF